MKRRDILKLGAAATAGTTISSTLGGAGCAAVIPGLEGKAGAPSADAFLATLDQHLHRVDKARFVEEFVAARGIAPRSPEATAALAEKDALFRRMLQTLLVTQSFRDLEPEAQLLPEVQARMEGHMDEVGATVFEVSDMLASLDTRQRAQVRRALRDHPDLPMSIAESIDRHASGISVKRRMQLRSMMASAAFRMRHGDPSSIIDEYVAKVERMQAQGTGDARALDLAQQVGERAFWRYQQHLAQPQPGAAAPAAVPPAPTPAAPVPPAPPPAAPAPVPVAPAATMAPGDTPPMAPAREPVPPRRRPRGRMGLRAGAYMMGIGTVVFGASALLVNVSEGFVVGATVGALLFAIGFVVVAISALVYLATM
jgi:hypothetical protein